MPATMKEFGKDDPVTCPGLSLSVCDYKYPGDGSKIDYNTMVDYCSCIIETNNQN